MEESIRLLMLSQRLVLLFRVAGVVIVSSALSSCSSLLKNDNDFDLSRTNDADRADAARREPDIVVYERTMTIW